MQTGKKKNSTTKTATTMMNGKKGTMSKKQNTSTPSAQKEIRTKKTTKSEQQRQQQRKYGSTPSTSRSSSLSQSNQKKKPSSTTISSSSSKNINSNQKKSTIIKKKNKPTTNLEEEAALSSHRDIEKNTNGDGGDGANENTARSVSKTLLLVWILVGAQLGFDFVTSVLSFETFLEVGKCCNVEIDMRGKPLRFAIPFLLLVLVELCMLLWSIKLTIFPPKQKDLPNYDYTDDGIRVTPRSHFSALWRILLPGGKAAFAFGYGWFRLINLLVLLNPLFGMIIAFMLLYQADETECFIVLGFETISMILHWIGLYVEGSPQTRWSIMVHCFPMLPYLIMVIVIAVTMNEGGVCYVAKDQFFMYDGCYRCNNETLPNEISGECPNDLELHRGDYCDKRDPTNNFCWYRY